MRHLIAALLVTVLALVGSTSMAGAANQPGEGERSGASLVARFPIGFDWHAGGGHAIGFDLNVNRALWVRRAGEEDPTPPNDRLVPLPGVSYRWAW